MKQKTKRLRGATHVRCACTRI